MVRGMPSAKILVNHNYLAFIAPPTGVLTWPVSNSNIIADEREFSMCQPPSAFSSAILVSSSLILIYIELAVGTSFEQAFDAPLYPFALSYRSTLGHGKMSKTERRQIRIIYTLRIQWLPSAPVENKYSPWIRSNPTSEYSEGAAHEWWNSGQNRSPGANFSA